MNRINSFSGNYEFLSNFFPCLIRFEMDTYSSVEHAYQAAKTDELDQRKIIRETRFASEAKRMGKHVKLRPNWDEIKLDIMEQLLKEKFTKQNELGRWLLKTGNIELVEGNWWGDTYWGVFDGIGENHLGKLLMKIRQEL